MDHENIINNILKGYIKSSEIDGYGLFAISKIKKEEVIGLLDGQLIPWDLYDKILQNNSLLRDFFVEWNAISINKLLVRTFRTKYSFINHSRKPNVCIMYNPIRIVAVKDIFQDEEIVLDYRKEPLRKEYLNGHGKSYL